MVIDPALWPGIRELVAERYRGVAWPEEYAVADLAWHRVMVDRGEAMPGRPKLMARWGWTDHGVRTLLAASPADRQPGTDQRRDSGEIRQPAARTASLPPAYRQPHTGEGGQLPEDRQSAASAPPAPSDPTRREPPTSPADRQPGTDQRRDSGEIRQPAASLARVRPDRDLDHDPARRLGTPKPPTPGPVRVGGRELPGDLVALLGELPAVGRRGTVEYLLGCGVDSTRAFLEVPAARWRFVGARDHAVVAAILRHLRERWRVEPGALAPEEAPARGAARPGGYTMRFSPSAETPTKSYDQRLADGDLDDEILIDPDDAGGRQILEESKAEARARLASLARTPEHEAAK